jgi:hypothetical protein
VAAIENAVLAVSAMGNDGWQSMMEKARRLAVEKYSRPTFSRLMEEAFVTVLER